LVVVLRLYAPLQPWFDKSWKPGDFDGSIECSTHGGRFNGGYMKPVLVIAALLGFPACSRDCLRRRPGTSFVVRVAGNIVDSAVTGSIEYALEHLGTPIVLVMGHERCGVVQATIEGGEPKTHIQSVVEAIAPAVASAKTNEGRFVGQCGPCQCSAGGQTVEGIQAHSL